MKKEARRRKKERNKEEKPSDSPSDLGEFGTEYEFFMTESLAFLLMPLLKQK